jgi:hypothetical protein
LLCTREPLTWRTEELARCACDALENDDVAAGILLTRAVVESTALIWRLKELLEDRRQYTADDLHSALEKMMMGWTNDPDFPNSVNILTMINHMDRQFHGVRERYDELSETAHPNWSGVFGLFAMIDRETYTAQFGRGLRKTTSVGKEIATTALNAYLELFAHTYNWIGNPADIYCRASLLGDGAEAGLSTAVSRGRSLKNPLVGSRERCVLENSRHCRVKAAAAFYHL